MARELEYLEEALEESEAAARWYAERNPTAAAFSDEIDAAETAIVRLPEAWPPFDHGTRRYLLRGSWMPNSGWMRSVYRRTSEQRWRVN